MSDRGKPYRPIHDFKKLVWRSSLSIGEPLERFTTWTLTGVAGITALLVANLDSVSRVISQTGLEAAIVLFSLSLLSGIFSKQFGTALSAGMRTVVIMEQYLKSSEGNELLGSLEIAPEKLIYEIAEPFPWPMSALIRRSGLKGIDDYLSADKTFITFFTVQLSLNIVHQIFAIAALATIGLSLT